MPISSIPDSLTPPENAVQEQFAGRPMLESVLQKTLTEAIDRKYPALNFDVAQTFVANPHAEGDRTLLPLMSRVMDYLASGAALDLGLFYTWPYYLADPTGNGLSNPVGSPDAKVIEALIKELPWSLPVDLQNALSNYWTEAADTGVSRWRWFSDVLKDTLSISAVRQSDLNDRARGIINQVIQCPEREERMGQYGVDAVHGYCLETRLSHSDTTSTRLSSASLLVNAHQALLCQPNGKILPFTDPDAAIEYEVQRIKDSYSVDEITINRYEPDGNIFDFQAATVLNRQLDALGALQLPAKVGLKALQAVYLELTDPAQYLRASTQVSRQTLEGLKTILPAWLLQASAADQALYRRYSLDMARVKKNSRGQTFLTGIADIRTFAADALQQQMKLDCERFEQDTPVHISGEIYLPDDIELTFDRATGYPGTSGIIDPVTMSLTDLALKNLVGRPGGGLTLSHRRGWALPAWLTPDYIVRRGALIEQVNIGRAYSERLEDLLLSNTPDALKRQQLFADQIRVQLPLQALESSIKHENGLTPLGARYVAALMQHETDGQQVDHQSVVISQLALLREPEAMPDAVSNMFIIEPAGMTAGPHLLYRPFYSPALHEFSSRAALLEAIATPGLLQDSVLIWLDDGARSVYANGGFQEPHFVRYGLGIENASTGLNLPAASLSTDGSRYELQQSLQKGQLLQYLYGSNARALISQASKESVTNSESRWGVLLEGAGLLFNTVLQPFLRGPAMLTVWLVSLVASVVKDIPALSSTDPIARELASVDLLLNLGMVLFQTAPGARPVHPPLSRESMAQVVRQRAPARSTNAQFIQPQGKRIQGVVALAGELPKAENTALDFSFSNARNRLTSSQHMALTRMQVTLAEPLPEPILNGLYVINGVWHVMAEGSLYRVEEETGGNWVIVDPHDISRRGPYLQWADGKWSLDLRLRLRGGMPKPHKTAVEKRPSPRAIQLKAEFMEFMKQQGPRQKMIDIAESVMQRAAADPDKYTPQDLVMHRQRYEDLLQAQTKIYTDLLACNQERIALGVGIGPETLAILMQNTVKNARKFVVYAELDRQAHYAKWGQFTGRGTELENAIAAQLRGYEQFVKELVAINERSIHWLELSERYLDELYDLGEPGAQGFTELSSDRPEGERSALSVKAMQLHALALPCVKVWSRTLPDSLYAVLNPLQEQVRTHIDLNVLDLPPGEHLDVLDSLVRHYAQALDALRGINIINVDELEPLYFDKLLALVNGLHQSTTQKLAAELKLLSRIQVEPSAELPARPKNRSPKRKSGSTVKVQKRVIKTRDRGQLIGQRSSAEEYRAIEVIEVRSEHDDKLLSAYSQHGEVWEEVKGALPAQPPRATRTLPVVKGEARKLFRQLDDHLKRAESYKKVSRYPQELEEVLAHEAERLDQLVAELEAAIQTLPEASRAKSDQELVADMRNGSAKLKNKGQLLRIELSFDLPPTSTNLRYLINQHLVRMAAVGLRVPLRGERKDFMQEYAIYRKDGTPLWYAHFHYAALDTPKEGYSVAHLKSSAQRRQSYYSLFNGANSDQGIVDVHRGVLDKDLAQQWFMPLAT